MSHLRYIIKKLLVISLIFLLIVVSFNINKVYAKTTYTQILKSGIDNFPEEYKTVLEQLKKLHPNWNFEAYYTGMDWGTVVLNETATHGRNRIIKSADVSWKCSCGNVASGYACASEGIVKYYLDPRNFLNEVNIFQFLEISYNEKIHTLDGVKNIVKNSFLANDVTYTLIEQQDVLNEKTGETEKKEVEVSYTKSYSEIILEAAKQSNMSPYSIAIKIIQEVGTNGSSSVSGTYEGYKGYYNFFNLGAYDTGDAISNGLRYARNKGWNNQYVSIIEGSKEIANSYTNAGQNTAYFYKWDVVGNNILKSGESKDVSVSDMFWHQYMTNVQDPTSQSKSLYNTYVKNAIINENLNFIIPIYNNMPSENAMPSGLTSDDGELYAVNCNDGLSFRSAPTTDSDRLGYLYRDTLVIMLEKECAEANGYKWDKIKLSNGVIGYVADNYLVLKTSSTVQNVDTKQETSTATKTETTEKQDIIINGDGYKSSGNNLIVLPNVTLSNIQGAVSGELKTGFKVKIGEIEYSVIMKGDTNGDGKSSAGDYVRIKNHIMQTSLLEGTESQSAADINNDGKISPADYVLIKNYIMYGNKFSL